MWWNKHQARWGEIWAQVPGQPHLQPWDLKNELTTQMSKFSGCHSWPTGPSWLFKNKTKQNGCLSILSSVFLARAGIIAAYTTVIASSLWTLPLGLITPPPACKRVFPMQPDWATSSYKILGFPNASGRKTKFSSLPSSHPHQPSPPCLCTCTLLFLQSLLCFIFAQPQGLCTAMLFLLSGMLCSFSCTLTPNHTPSISSGKSLLTSLTESDHPELTWRNGTLFVPCTFLLSKCHCSSFNSFVVLG